MALSDIRAHKRTMKTARVRTSGIQPLFVIGAPRSGTTFLCHILNQHPAIQLTNESRIFVLLKDLVEVRGKRPDLIGRDFRELFVDFLCSHAGSIVERFYRESLGIDTPIWGDKHPPYGDPSVLSGRTGSQPRSPQSGSCLRLIRTLLPAPSSSISIGIRSRSHIRW